MPARALPPPNPDAEADLAALLRAMSPDELEAFARELPDDDRMLLEYVMGEAHSAGWRSDPIVMAAHLDSTVRAWRYQRILSAAFVRAITGESTRQIWNLPSRMGKSTTLRWGVTWALDRNGRGRWIWVSYQDELALESAFVIRDQIRTHAADLRVRLRRDRQKVDRFWTDQGGGLLAAGINTAIVGFGAGDGGGLIIDDPMKNWQEAHAESKRDHVANQFFGTLRHRLDQESAPIIVCHARWHKDDLSGRLKDAAEQGTGEAWEMVTIPALAVAGKPDALDREPGEPIEPERFPAEDVRARHFAMGHYLTAALEQQDPLPPEGKELLREWFVLATSSELPTAPDEALTSWDLKLKDREAGDYVVGQVWWRVSGGYWLMDQLRGHYDHATTANAIALLAVRHPEVKRHVVEAAGSADEVLPQLRKPQPGYEVSDDMAERLAMTPDERVKVAELRRRGMARLVPNSAKGDKSVRARAYIAPYAEPGHVRMPADAPWVAALLDELTAFPEGLHDDQVDAMSQGLQKLVVGPASVSGAKGNVGRPQPGAHRATPPQAAPANAAAASRRARVITPTGTIGRRLPRNG